MPDRADGGRTGLKNSLLAIFARCSSSLATRIEPLNLKEIIHFLAFSPCVAKT